MTLMHDTLISPDGTPVPAGERVVVVTLAPSSRDVAFVDSKTIVHSTEVFTDSDGHFEVDLPPSSTLLPSGTVFQALYRDYAPVFSVPDSGPTWISGNLVGPPGPLESSALTLHINNPSDAHAASAISGLGTAALEDVEAFDPAGSAAGVETSASTVITEVRDVFTGKPDGKPTAPDRGPAYNHYGGSVGEAAELRVVGGKLTIQPSVNFPASGYAQPTLSGSVRRIGARFTLSPYSTASGAAALIAWATPIAGVAPNSPCHLAVGATATILTVYTGGSPTTIGSWTYDTPLVADDATVHTADVRIDRETSTVFVTLPSPWKGRRTVTASHALVGSVTAPVACLQVFGLNATDARAKYLDWWADSKTTELSAIRGLATIEGQILRQAPVSVSLADSTDITVPGTTTTTGISRSIVIPPSGKVLVSLNGFLAMSVSGDIVWTVRIGATTKVFRYVVRAGQVNQQIQLNAEMSGTGMTIGALVTFEWFHVLTSGGGTSTLRVSSGHVASMTLTPLDP